MASILHDRIVHTVGERRALLIHYHATTTPASFLTDPTKVGLFDKHGTHLDFRTQGQPLLLSSDPAHPAFNVFEFRWEPAFLDTLVPGDSYYFRVVDGDDTHIWTVETCRSVDALGLLPAALLNNMAWADASLNSISVTLAACLSVLTAEPSTYGSSTFGSHTYGG